MPFNPFNEKPIKLEKCYEDWKRLYLKPYNKYEVDPYTRVRIILAAGAEFEATWFSHQFQRHCPDNAVRRVLAGIRRSEQMQQKRLASLKPINETLLETTIGYEQVAVDLTANLAQMETDNYIKAALDFALLEDFDHLYRFSDLLEMEHGVLSENLVGGYTEIMPGRPTISEHRFPFDDVKRHVPSAASSLQSKLNTGIITAAEQQTMNYYMNVGQFYASDLGRKLFSEIALIEEQHVTHYGSLLDTDSTWLESLLLHEYTECYLYYSLMLDETDDYVKKVWETHLNQEISHLHLAKKLLNNYESKDYNAVVGNGDFPSPLAFNRNAERNREYVRNILKNTVTNTAVLEDYAKVKDLPDNYAFFKYNKGLNGSLKDVASHKVIDNYIAEFGEDYRFETKNHPIKELRDRKKDNTAIGRDK
ncbi:MAG: hypothetical protein FWE84_02305 [Firmicutes bacterium]|nr:hypothetical protein [Bacillota bacterium]